MIPGTPSTFSRRALIWLVSIGVTSFMALVVISALAGNTSGNRAGPNPYSESAVGYRGLVDFLENLQMPVLISRDRGLAERLDRDTMQILLEPANAQDLGAMLLSLTGGGPVLVVLPKWRGDTDPAKPSWVSSVLLLDERAVNSVTPLLVKDLQVVRPKALHTVYGPYGAAPTVPRPQLFRSKTISPIVRTDQGILLGWVWAYGTNVYVLSDPDILNNHGLGKGANARLAASIIEDIRNGNTVVVDATLQGFTRSPSQWRSLFEPPLLPVTVLALATCGVLFWTAASRFGAPLPAPPRLASGKQGLIDNTAQLLEFAGHFGVLLDRYRASAIREVSAALHAPAGLDQIELARWLDRIATARGFDISYADLVSDREAAGKAVGGHGMLSSARRIHRWKTEMLRGSIAD